jgi:hypothetical protein
VGAAQKRFDRLVKSVWGPALRQAGFKGSGKVFVLPDDRDWAMVGLQTSSASTGDESKFTINLLVVGKNAWQEAREQRPWYSTKPSPNTVALCRYQQRAGFLTHGRDQWWRLAGDGSNEGQIRDEILDVLIRHVVPKLKIEMANQQPGPRGMLDGQT